MSLSTSSLSDTEHYIPTGWGTTRQTCWEGRDIAEEYESVRRWFLNLKRGSQRNYRVSLRKFIHYMRLDPDQLLELARKDPVSAHGKLKEFWHKVGEAEGLSSESKGNYYTSIRSFLRWNDVELGRMPRMFIGKVQYESYHVLESSEISKMIDYARTGRDQALVSFLAQSGQRTGVVSAMKYRHVQEDLEKGTNPIVVNVNPELFGREDGFNVNKTGLGYRFAIGRECASFLRMSLNQRRRMGEEITSESWLFPATRKLDRIEANGHPISVGLGYGEQAPPITTSGIHRIVVDNAKKAGLDRVRYGPRLHGARTVAHEIHPHTFRRWWKFQMRRGGVIDSVLLEHMMGQRNVRVRHGGNYDEFDPDYVRREYSKAEPFLTVTCDPVSYKLESQWKPSDPTPQLLRPKVSQVSSRGNKAIENRAGVWQRVVKEGKLDWYLSRGWQYVATLPSARIVIGMPLPTGHNHVAALSVNLET